MRHRKDVAADGREDGQEPRGVGGGEIIIRLHCMKKINFNKRENEKKRNQATKG